MVRALSSRPIRLFAAVAVLVASAPFSDLPAHAGGEDRALAEQHLRPGQAPDPVLAALADGRLVRQVGAPPAGTAAVSPVPVGFALTGEQLAALDVSATPEAASEIDGFVARLKGRGIEVEGDTWTVYALPSIDGVPVTAETDGDGPLPSALVVPAGTRVDLVGAVFEDGQLHAKTALTTSSAGGAPPERRLHPAAASDPPAFVRDAGLGCVARKQNNSAWYDACQQFHVLENDGDPTGSYWASEMRGTGKGKGRWTLNGLGLSSWRTKSMPEHEWVDWEPGADADFSCRAQSVTVGHAGASVGLVQQHCELWDVDKGEEGANFANWWRADQRGQEREVAAMSLTKLHRGEFPTLRLSIDHHATP